MNPVASTGEDDSDVSDGSVELGEDSGSQDREEWGVSRFHRCRTHVTTDNKMNTVMSATHESC